MKHGLMPLTASAFLRYSPDGASGGATPPAEPKPEDAPGGDKDEKKFSQADVDVIVEGRLKREREKQEREKADAARVADEATKAEAARKLAEDKRFEELVGVKQTEIDSLTARVKDGETAAQRAARFEALLTERRDAEFGKLPEEVTALLAGKDIAEQIEWLTKYGAKFTRTEEKPVDTGKKGGTPRPEKGRTVSTEPTDKERVAAKRAQLGIG